MKLINSTVCRLYIEYAI